MSEKVFAGASADPQRSYLHEGHTLRSWLATTDHKRIGILYALSITGFFFIAGVAIGLVRLDLLTPAGDLLSDDQYNRLFTLHGILMVWFFLVPSIPATLGNFLLPLMVGASDVAFPRLNLMSWYLFMAGGMFTIYSLVAGGVDTGWTFYTPFSTLFSNSHVIAAAAGVFVVGFSSIATGVNFITTTHLLRAPGLTWTRLPLMVWALYATSIVMVLATPVLAVTLLLVMAERLLGLPIFDPANGGDPILFQHLFWFYSHPAVYIMILPAMGVISEVITCFARRRVFGYTAMVYSMMAIAVIGFMVWGHHMFVSGQSPYASLVFSFLSFMVAVPSAIKVFNWTTTLYRGEISFEAPMLYAMAFLGLFTIGGLTGLFLASVPVDVHVTDTYFVVAHFHFIMVGGSVSAYFAGLHYWWPKITGRMYNEPCARFAAVATFVGFMVTFLPQ
ncbi:MAG: cbb3-type cytochrome c oxidase subunit I, partial [Gammaproteobacteria bacterium]|nr:cbb3-type cytochrome c oxidase subunit I [Gammaproteobacteria bacterium]